MSKPLILPAQTVHALCINQGIPVHYTMDAYYVLLTENYLFNKALPAYHAFLEWFFRDQEIYQLETLDCDDAGQGFSVFVAWLHRRYHPYIRAGLAVGWGIHLDRDHVLTVALIREKKGIFKLCVYESTANGRAAKRSHVALSRFLMVCL